MERKIKLLLTSVLLLGLNTLFAQVPDGWTYNPRDFEGNSTITAITDINDDLPEDAKLGAFIGGECRGVTSLTISPVGKLFFLMYYMNNDEEGNELVLKLFVPGVDAGEPVELDILNPLPASLDEKQGTVQNPFLLNVNREIVISGRVNIGDLNADEVINIQYGEGLSIPVTDSGDYSFIVDLPWEGVITPVSNAYEFTPSAVEYNEENQLWVDKEGLNFTTEINRWIIFGRVATSEGNGIPGVQIASTDGGTIGITNSEGNYTLNDIYHGWSGRITPLHEEYIFTPAYSFIDDIDGDLIRDFEATKIKFWIRGVINYDGNPLPGVRVYYGNDEYVTTDNDGKYGILTDGSYCDVRPELEGYVFKYNSTENNHHVYSGLQTDLNSENYEAFEVPEVTYFAINGGDATTDWNVVTLNNLCDQNVTQYRASMDKNLLEADAIPWYDYSSEPAFDIGFNMGVAKVYFQVKTDNDVSSSIYEDEIELGGVQISGCVKDAEGNPIEGVEIIFDMEIALQKKVYTDTNGNYSVSVLGEYVWKAYLTKPGYTFYDKTEYRRLIDIEHPFFVGYSPEARVIDFEGEQKEIQLIVTTYNNGGDKLRDVKVLLNDTDYGYTTDDLGKCELTIGVSIANKIDFEKWGYSFPTLTVEATEEDYINYPNGIYRTVSATSDDCTYSIYSYDRNSQPIPNAKLKIKYRETLSSEYTERTEFTDSNGVYVLECNTDYNGIISIDKPGYVFEVPEHGFDFSPIRNPFYYFRGSRSRFVISGNISTQENNPVGGIRIHNDQDSVLYETDINGNFAISVDSAWSGRLTPYDDVLSFIPEFLEYQDVQADTTGQNFIADYSIVYPDMDYKVQLVSDSLKYGDKYGEEIVIFENYCIVGAPGTSINNPNVGKAHVYAFIDGNWKQDGTLNADNNNIDNLFGSSVEINSQYAFVGAFGEETYKGTVYVFRKFSDEWQIHQKIVLPDGNLGDKFGYKLSLSGNSLAVSAPGKNRVYIFSLLNDSWQQDTIVDSPSNDGTLLFGSTLEFEDEFLAVGVGEEDPLVYLFRDGAEGWLLTNTLTGENNSFGKSITISGNYLVINSFLGDSHQNNSGCVYAYKWNDDNWQEVKRIFSDNPSVEDNFGYDVKMSEHRLLVTAPNQLNIDENTGSVYLYNRLGDNWILSKEFKSGTGNEGFTFGNSADFAGNRMFIGVVDTTTDNYGGEVFAYGNTEDFSTREISGYFVDAENTSYSGIVVEFSDGQRAITDQSGFFSARVTEGWSGTIIPLNSEYSFEPLVREYENVMNDVSNQTFRVSYYEAQYEYEYNLPIVFRDIDISTDFVFGGSNGAISLYKFINCNWTTSGGLSEGSISSYGYSLSEHDGMLAVGAFEDDDNNGAVYFYKYDGNNWNNFQKISGFDDERFGVDVSLDNKYAIVKSNKTAYGWIYFNVYNYDGTQWKRINLTRPPGVQAYQYYGGSYDISGEFIVISESGNDEVRTNAGAVYIFRNGEFFQKLLPDNTCHTAFGASVSIHNNQLIVGTGADCAVIYRFDGIEWVKEALIKPDDLVNYDRNSFSGGGDIEIYGNYAFIAAQDQDLDRGAVYIYRKDQNGWFLEKKIIGGLTDQGDHFGKRIAVINDHLMISSDRETYFYGSNELYKINKISGFITNSDGSSAEGLLLKYSDGYTSVTDSDGYYERIVHYNWSGEVIPDNDGLMFTPRKRKYYYTNTSFSNQNFLCELPEYEFNDYKNLTCIGAIYVGLFCNSNIVRSENYLAVADYQYNGSPSTGRIQIENQVFYENSTDLMFGYSMQFCGDKLLVGVPPSDGNNFGRVSLYEKTYSWSYRRDFFPVAGESTAEYGTTVALSSDFVFIGDRYARSQGGIVYIYYHNGTLKQKLRPYGTTGFGEKVLYDESKLYVVCSEGGTKKIKIYYKNDNGYWIFEDELIGESYDFGYLIKKYDNWLITVSRSRKKIYFYKYTDNAWSLFQTITGGIWMANPISADLNENYLVVGAPYDDEIGSYKGAIYVYRFNGETWSQQDKLYSEETADTYFGKNVTIFKDKITCGSNQHVTSITPAISSIDTTYSISGTISNLAGEGMADVYISIGDEVVDTTNLDGTYAVEVSSGWSGNLNAAKPGYDFEPSVYNFQQLEYNIENLCFTGQPASPITFVNRINGSTEYGESGSYIELREELLFSGVGQLSFGSFNPDDVIESVSIDSNYAAIKYEEENFVRVYKSIGGLSSWEELTFLSPPDQTGSRFGYQLIVIDDQLFISDYNAGSSGIIYRYQLSQVGCELMQSFSRGYNCFGYRMCVNEDEIAVIGRGITPDFKFYSKVYIIGESGDEWNITQTFNPEPENNKGSCSYIRMSSNFLAVGSYSSDQIYIFNRNENGWTQSRIIEGVFNNSKSVFDISDDLLIISSFSEGINRDVLVYKRSGESYDYFETITNNDVEILDDFGAALALGNEQLVIGAPKTDINGRIDAGAVYFYNIDRDALTVNSNQLLKTYKPTLLADIDKGKIKLQWFLAKYDDIEQVVLEKQKNDEWFSIHYTSNADAGSFVDSKPDLNNNKYRINCILKDNTKLYSSEVEIDNIVTEYHLSQNYPNPFNPTTTIKFDILEKSNVELSIYNILGQRVETLVQEELDAGYHKVEFDASRFASGVYIYMIRANDFRDVKKMVLLK